MADHLFEPLKLGRMTAPNRVFFAPCTRHRATFDETPTKIMVEYYRQRASSGLLISEGINPSPMGRGYYYVPGLYKDEHEEGWRSVTEAVHNEGGRIFAQMMHVGRLASSELLPGGATPIAPSAVQPDPNFRGYTVSCPRPDHFYEVPEELSIAGIHREIDAYADATRRAYRAGFDGVEIHAASGYLPMQFLSSNTNRRADAYGGSIQNRVRFLLELVEAMSAVDGPERLAVKLSPAFRFQNVEDKDPVRLYAYVAKQLSARGLAYVQVSDYGDYYNYEDVFDPIALVRQNFDGLLVANGGLTRETGEALIASGQADAIAYGSAYIANPDLVERFKARAPVNRPDPSTFYTQGEEGYTDYPRMEDEPASGVTVGKDYVSDYEDFHKEPFRSEITK